MSVDSWGRTPTKPQSTKPNYPLHESHVSLKVRCLRLLFICFFILLLTTVVVRLFLYSCILLFSLQVGFGNHHNFFPEQAGHTR